MVRKSVEVLVIESCPTLMDCSPQGSSVRGISQARVLEWVAIPFSRDLPDSGIEPTSPVLAGRFFTTEPLGKPEMDSYRESKRWGRLLGSQ